MIRGQKRHDGDVPEAYFHKIKYVNAATNEEEFHDEIIEGDPCRE